MAFQVPDVLLNGLRRFPDRPCVTAGERGLTFRQLNRRSDQLCHALRAHGLQPGDRLALLYGNEIEFAEAQIACMRGGWVLVPLNYRLAAREMRDVLMASGARLLIASPAFAATAAALETEHWTLGPAYEQRLADAPAPADDAPQRFFAPELPVQLLGTSGTTGKAKLVSVTNGCLWARIQLACTELDIRPGDVLVNALALFHVVNNYLMAWLYRGASVTLLNGFDPAALVHTIQQCGGTHLLAAPTLVRTLCDAPGIAQAPMPSLRLLIYGGAPMAPEVLRRAMDTLQCRYLQTYGMTETTSLTILRPDDHDPVGKAALLGSAGTDAISLQTRIVDAQDAEVGVGVPGEITVRGPCVTDGYWGDAQATAQALRGGWFHTGDIGYRNAEGYVFIVDRLKDIIVSGGENIASREVEDALYEHPGVREVAVIGVPDERWGERVHAVVVPTDAGVDGDALISHCRERLGAYKVPKSVELVTELPKNEIGKILKREVRKRYWGDSTRQIG